MSRLQNLLLLHFIVVLFGFTGILGKLITLEADVLVWYRMMIGGMGLLLYLIITGRIRNFFQGPTHWLVLLGAVVAMHWITFFESIKVSNVSVALATISATALFVALFTPFFERKHFLRYEVFLGLMAVLGLVLIFGFEPQYTRGIVLALISSSLAAIFTLANAKILKQTPATVISTVEILSGAIILLGYLAVRGKIEEGFWDVSSTDWMWLVILGLVCTSFAFAGAVEVMKQLRPFSVAISVNLEPVYSILLALWIFGEEEHMSGGFYFGALVILSTIFINAWLKARHRRREAKVQT